MLTERLTAATRSPPCNPERSVPAVPDLVPQTSSLCLPLISWDNGTAARSAVKTVPDVIVDELGSIVCCSRGL